MTAAIRTRLRFGLWALLIAGWAVAVWLMWVGMGSGPSDPRLETSPIASPTMRTFYAAALFSGLELAVILAILWPPRPEYYATRLAVSVTALATWFVLSTRIDATGMDRVHRQWLIAMIAMLAVALAATLLYRATRRFDRPREE
ncbi:MAG: hypothetical protein KY466_01015 [Gemmatimonadetes bacterium]|nr:hypothetical protein [Gemmatimonadota bacterium]